MLAWSDYGYSGYNWSLIASDRIIKERPDAVKGFVRAFKKSVEFVMANPEEAGKILHEMVPNKSAETNTTEIRAMVPLIKNDISEKYGLGAFEPSLVRETWKWVAESNNLPKDKIDPLSVVDASFLPGK